MKYLVLSFSRNCKGNPHCFEGLGEKEWLGDVDESSWVELDDPLNERRIEVNRYIIHYKEWFLKSEFANNLNAIISEFFRWTEKSRSYLLCEQPVAGTVYCECIHYVLKFTSNNISYLLHYQAMVS